MNSATAQAALVLWPLVATVLYLSRDSLSATFWTIFGGFLLLPVGASIDFPLVPPIDKESLPPLVALFCLRYLKGERIPLLPKQRPARWLVPLLLTLPVFTVLTNPEPIVRENSFIPGLSWHDAASSVVGMYLGLLPFIIGISLIKTAKELTAIAKLIVIAALAYSVPVLFEVRMSPQLHTWIYGYTPSSFGQQMRFGGFRPVVFIGHGLSVSMFVAVALAFAALLWELRMRATRWPAQLVVLYLALVLVVCKTVGAAVLALLMVAPIVMLSARSAHRLSKVVAVLVICYPVLSLLGFIPKEAMVIWVEGFLPDRAQSLEFRFFHETQLLERALQKPWFGWGGWGRGHLENSVTDGYWIIKLGELGLIGFFTYFGLLLQPLLRRQRQQQNPQDSMVFAGFALVLAAVLVDQLPNASMTAPYLFLFGAFAGAASKPDLSADARLIYKHAGRQERTAQPEDTDIKI